MSGRAELTLDHVAAHGLSAAPPPEPGEPLDDESWGLLLAGCRVDRLTGLLVAGIHDGALPATDEQRAEAMDALAADMRQALVLENRLLVVHGLLASAGIETRVLKGLAVAHLDHPDPTRRSFQDVDLLVRAADIEWAVALLEAAGHRRDLPPRRPGWDHRFSKDLVLVGPDGAEVDLHRTLVPGAFGFTIDPDDLWGGAEPMELGGTTLQALDRPRRAMHAAYALTVGEAAPRRSAARDLAEVLRGDVGAAALIDLAQRWRADALLAEALLRAERWLGEEALPPSLTGWAGQLVPSTWQRLVRRTYRSSGSTNTATLLAGVLGLPWRQRAPYLLGLGLPSRAYQRARRSSGRPPERRTAIGELLKRDRAR